MKEEWLRTSFLIGEDNVRILNNSRIIVFGLGGVGGYAVEALARSGVGAFILVDNDIVSITNINRQIIATVDTIGRYKTEVMKERILSINADAHVEIYNMFYLPENADTVKFEDCDYAVDAVDTVTAKLEIIMRAKQAGIPVISSMGTGNKLNPAMLETADIYDTSVCPLARVMRRELKKRGIDNLKVVYSREEPVKAVCSRNQDDIRDSGISLPPGSVSFVPSAAGLIIASEVIKDLIQIN